MALHYALVPSRMSYRDTHTVLYSKRCITCKISAFSRPLYIESCVCVFKDVVKCSFEYLCVVHHDTRCQHNVGVGGGAIAEEYFESATPGQKTPETTKSKTKKNLGIGSPVFCSFFAHYTGLFKDMGKTEVRGKGGCDAFAH